MDSKLSKQKLDISVFLGYSDCFYPISSTIFVTPANVIIPANVITPANVIKFASKCNNASKCNKLRQQM